MSENSDSIKQDSPLLPYVLPFILFMVFTAGLEAQFKSQYPLVYIAKVVVVSIALMVMKRPLRDVRIDARNTVTGIVSGLVLCAVWIGIENGLHYPHPSFLGSRVAFNPFKEIDSSGLRMAFIAVRLIGLSLMVPVMEEIFWRSFLQRYITKPEFENVPIRNATLPAIAGVSALFAASHPEWLPALIFGAAMSALLRKTGSLWSCICAHAITNLSLGIYVLISGDWKFW